MKSPIRLLSSKSNLVILLLLFLSGALLACGLNIGRILNTADDEPAPAQEEVETVVDQAEAAAGPAEADQTGSTTGPVPATDTARLREAVTPDGIRRHLAKLQEIADANEGRRTSGTAGYDASAAYVREQLEGAGYVVTEQTFEFQFFQDATEVEQIEPRPTTYVSAEDFATLIFSAAGEVTAPVQPVGISEPLRGSSNSGCQSIDFIEFKAGNIALIERGRCTFAQKGENAEKAGASAVLIFNDGAQPDREEVILGTLGEPGIGIPVVGLSFGLGEALYRLTKTDEVIIHIKADIILEDRLTSNIIADTPGGRDDFVVVVGAHLDSVPTGPGIQDNGSGSAAILEVALQMAELEIEPANKVRFAFWGAEEFGLVGSRHYVEQLSRAELDQIALNLNFDMVASPNYTRFVYDGDQSAFSPDSSDPPIPPGSAAVEQIFHDYFDSQGLELAETPFDGRSDYGPFIQAGIPAGGLFSGADEVKAADEVPDYGGAADEAYDACYHLTCDTIDNINWQALDEMSDAAAHAILIFATTDQPLEDMAGD